jgi:hypothetical protein
MVDFFFIGETTQFVYSVVADCILIISVRCLNESTIVHTCLAWEKYFSIKH